MYSCWLGICLIVLGTSFVCAANANSIQTIVLSSYPSDWRHHDFYDNLKIWEVTRATLAAPTFLKGFTSETAETFINGAMGANNPNRQLWAEAGEIWRDENHLSEWIWWIHPILSNSILNYVLIIKEHFYSAPSAWGRIRRKSCSLILFT